MLSAREREDIASEPRHWVRISRACNNHCVFCLDSDVQDGTFVARSEVEAEIDRGIEKGAVRLILSGGEASIHPDFLRLVTYGKERGYAHVQTITNGRMFAYERFVARAIEAGIDEITFSLHGHTPELGDLMTGVPGSFVQTLAGIRNVVATGRCIVSGDVVVNGRNVGHLREILDLFVSLGVREIDILMVMPFGRASPGDRGSNLLLDPPAALESLGAALELSRRPGIHLWTNRVDPALLEGFEDLIQDPHKLHDEINGRREMLDDLVHGRRMRCTGPRCSHCFIRGLCSSMRGCVSDLGKGVPGILRVTSGADLSGPGIADLAGRDRSVRWVEAADADEAAPLTRAIGGRALWLALRDLGGLRRAIDSGALPRPSRLIIEDPESMEASRGIDADEILIGINRSTAGRIAGLSGRSDRRTILAYIPAVSLAQSIERDVDLGSALERAGRAVRVDIPPCLGGSRSVRYEDPFDLSMVGRDGLVDPDAFADHFIRWRYRVKSLRCRSCRFARSCRGIHINQARHAGLGILSPVR